MLMHFVGVFCGSVETDVEVGKITLEWHGAVLILKYVK